MSCGHSQVLFINFGVRTQKIRRAYLNGQIVSEFVSGCLNLNLNFRLNFKYVSESMTWAFQITIVDLTTRPGSKVMTFQRHHYQPGSGQPFKPFSAVNLTVSGFPV